MNLKELKGIIDELEYLPGTRIELRQESTVYGSLTTVVVHRDGMSHKLFLSEKDIMLATKKSLLEMVKKAVKDFESRSVDMDLKYKGEPIGTLDLRTRRPV